MDTRSTGFDIEPLAEMVAIGAVGPRSVRLWARAPGAERVLVEVVSVTALPSEKPPGAVVSCPVERDADDTVAFTIPTDTPGLEPLVPDHAYEVRVRREDGTLVGEGRFRTAPEEPVVGRFAFAIASCHQPFDGQGRLQRDSVRMLEGVADALDAADARFLLQVGDQIYADYPPSRSLFNGFFEAVAPKGRRTILECTRQEVRALYHTRHRLFFGVPAMRAIMSRLPSHPMLDDHEIRDNYGSAPEHASELWRAVRDGARDAFFDYQAARVMTRFSAGASFHHGFVNGPVAVFMMDLRSERRADASTVSIVSDKQLDDLARFLEEHAAVPAAAIVVTVPVAHIDSSMAGAAIKVAGASSDVADRWSNPKALADRNKFLRVVRAHQRKHREQRVMLLGGDIHVGCLLCIDWDDDTPPLYQFTSSALSNKSPRVAQWAAEQVPRLFHGVARGEDISAHIAVIGGEGENPYGGLNLGIVEVEVGAQTKVRFKLLGEPLGEGPLRVVFDSGPL